MVTIVNLVLSMLLCHASSMRKFKGARTSMEKNAGSLSSGVPDCKTLCTTKFQNDQRAGALDASHTFTAWVQACTRQELKKGTCRDMSVWDRNRANYYTKPFALPTGQTCDSACLQKSKDKLSNPYAPNFANQYIQECVPTCQQYAQTQQLQPTWDRNRANYYTKPFALPAGQTCDSVCRQKSRDKLSNPYAPNFANQYIQECVPTCQQYAQTQQVQPTWDRNRANYYTKPFALPAGQTCDSVCRQKSRDKLSNPYAPNFADRYIQECVPTCSQYAQIWTPNRANYYTAPFIIRGAQTCVSLCRGRSRDTVSNPYAPNFANEYYNECVPTCNQYGQRLPECKTFCTQSFNNDQRKGALDKTMTLDEYVKACTQQQSKKDVCDATSSGASRMGYSVLIGCLILLVGLTFV